MRINKYIAQATGLSRRHADEAIGMNRVLVNGQRPQTGMQVSEQDVVSLDGKQLQVSASTQTILFNKPPGYVCSRDGQGSPTVYELLPPELHHLKPIGRLDKDSSGLLLLSDDGNLAFELTHPSHQKQKVYHVMLDTALSHEHFEQINNQGVVLEDGISRLALRQLYPREIQVIMSEGRNRQIRRTFAALGYTVETLQRTDFGTYHLSGLRPGAYEAVTTT